MKKQLVLAITIILLSGCTSINVKPVDASHSIKHVCIEDNPKVIVADFVSTVEDVFQDHGITTEIYSGNTPERCTFKLTYTALRSWDFSPYLSHAELRLYRGHKRIGYAEYHLKGGGGLSLNKWASVESKMRPVVNELLAQYR